MYEVYQRIALNKPVAIDETVKLDHSLREKGRFKAVTDSGQELRVFLQRGQTLQIGEILKTHCGKYVRVEGALESCCVASCDNWLQFAKACYHLGNRHVKVEIRQRELVFIDDHVLADMLRLLGLQLRQQSMVFCPESGAYAHQPHGQHSSSHHEHQH